MTCHCGKGADPLCWGDEGMGAHKGRCCDCFDSTLIPKEEWPFGEDGFCAECAKA